MECLSSKIAKCWTLTEGKLERNIPKTSVHMIYMLRTIPPTLTFINSNYCVVKEKIGSIQLLIVCSAPRSKENTVSTDLLVVIFINIKLKSEKTMLCTYPCQTGRARPQPLS